MLPGLLIGLFTIYYLLSTPASARASSFDLSVSPSILQIELTPPAVANVKETITLENNGDEPLSLKLSYRSFRPSGDAGELTYLTEDESPGNDPLIFQRISVMDGDNRLESFVIPPKTKKQYNLVISIPKDEPSDDYYFSLIFLTEQDQSIVNKTTGSTSLGGVALNVLLSIGPKTQTTGSIEDFSTPFFQPEGPVAFNVKIKNTSKHFIYPKAQILITNMFGQRIGKVELLPVNILSDSTRSLPSKEQFVLNAQAEQCQEQGDKCEEPTDDTAKLLALSSDPKALWPERFILGPYTATLTVAFSDEGPLYTRSLLFIGLPVYIFAGFAIALILLLMIRTRLKHHQKI